MATADHVEEQEGRVVDVPVDGKLDQRGRAVGPVVEVGVDVVHEVTGEGEAVAVEQGEGVRA